MNMDLLWIRGSLLVALGLSSASCGPNVTEDLSSGEGSAEGTSSASEGSVSSADSTTSADGTISGDGTTGNGWPEPPWCGLPPPDNATPPPPCENPQPIMAPGGGPTGFVRCDAGWVHREEIVECTIAPDAVGTCWDNSFGECMSDADCGPGGFCNVEGGMEPYCSCHVPCATDADCSADQICLCNGPASRCVTAYCKSDDDCGEYSCAGNYYGAPLGCHTGFDQCHNPAECPSPPTGECPTCEYASNACAWVCNPSLEACTTAGRPFLVDDSCRLAPLIQRTDWSTTAPPCPDLDPATRHAVSQHWLEVARMEHASVAAFARFALQLTALGAPPDLLVATTQAMQDELEHARLAFTLARRYAGKAFGPGPLPVNDALTGALDPITIAELTIREACIGETIAAVEATRALERATDPEVRAALQRIAADELRHAELGWRFVAWVLRNADQSGRARLRQAFTRALAEGPLPAPPTPFTPTAPHHGVLSPDARHQIRQQTLHQIISPVARTLLATAEDPQPVASPSHAIS